MAVKTKYIHILVTEKDKIVIARRAEELGLTVSEHIRRLILADLVKSGSEI
nr:MAG TPA: antitoxin [Caudoviricetes sp.]